MYSPEPKTSIQTPKISPQTDKLLLEEDAIGMARYSLKLTGCFLVPAQEILKKNKDTDSFCITL